MINTLPGIPDAPVSSKGSYTFQNVQHKRLIGTMVALVVAVLALGAGTMRIVNTEVRTLVSANVHTTLQIAVAGAEQWLEQHRQFTTKLAGRAAVASLAQAAATGDSKSMGSLRKNLDEFAAPNLFDRWAVLDSKGAIVATGKDAIDFKRLPEEGLWRCGRRLDRQDRHYRADTIR